MNPKETDICVISYPCSGRTWLMVLLGRYLVRAYNLPDNKLLDTHILTHMAGLPIVDYGHAGAATVQRDRYGKVQPASHYKDLGFSRNYQRKNIIYISRNAKDILVSYWFHATRGRREIPYIPLSEFIRHPQHGAPKLNRFRELWRKNWKGLGRTMVLRYEEMQQDTCRELKKTLRFIGVKPVSGLVRDAVQFAGIKKMRKLEREDHYNDKRLRPFDPDDPMSYKCRRGIVGGWKDYLSHEDAEYIDATVKETDERI